MTCAMPPAYGQAARFVALPNTFSRALGRLHHEHPGMAKARQMRVRRASTGGLSGGQGPTRASHVSYLIRKTCPTRMLFGFLIVDLFNFHKPCQPPLTWLRPATL